MDTSRCVRLGATVASLAITFHSRDSDAKFRSLRVGRSSLPMASSTHAELTASRSEEPSEFSLTHASAVQPKGMNLTAHPKPPLPPHPTRTQIHLLQRQGTLNTHQTSHDGSGSMHCNQNFTKPLKYYHTLNTQLRYGMAEAWKVSTAGVASSVTMIVTRPARRMAAASLHSRETDEAASRSLTPSQVKQLWVLLQSFTTISYMFFTHLKR
ncbi:hypothetical protein E2C01_014575 [Portunus trituberculatus]|uniref:Uncharacterized protein n=1 Tax=Portunus trituberculatus TaxID=210409 RepID=A0A5B7DKG0_PORTR|nr:hypothetical protein [Portunus trituberculatus]